MNTKSLNKNIVIIGASLGPNLGDQAVFFALKQIISENGNYTFDRYPLKPESMAYLSEKFTLRWFLQIARIIFADFPIHYVRLVKVVLKSNLVIIGGGNLILDYSINGPLQFLLTCIIAKILKRKLFICAIGAGPIRYNLSKSIFRVALNLADKISVRDEYSFNVLTSQEGLNLDSGIIVKTADPAFVPIKEFGEKIQNRNNIIGISTFGYETPYHHNAGSKNRYDHYIQNMAKLVDEILKQVNAKIVLIPTDSTFDVRAMNDIYNLVSRKDDTELSHPNSVGELLSLIRNCDILVGTRMHSMILALPYNIPVIGLTWAGKINALFDAIDSPNLMFNIESFNSKEVAEIVKKVYSNRQEYSEYLKEKVSKIQKLSRLNGQIVEDTCVSPAIDRTLN